METSQDLTLAAEQGIPCQNSKLLLYENLLHYKFSPLWLLYLDSLPIGVLLKDSTRDICRGVLAAPVGVVARLWPLAGFLTGVALGLAELPTLEDEAEPFPPGVTDREPLVRSLYSSAVPFSLLTDLKDETKATLARKFNGITTNISKRKYHAIFWVLLSSLDRS